MDVADDPNIGATLDALEQQAEQAESQEGEFLPGASPAPEQSAPSISTGEAMGLLVKVVCDVIASRRGKHWKLKSDEATAVGEAYGAVLDAWIPIERMGPTVTAVMISAVVFGPRVALDRQLASEKREAEKQPEGKPKTETGRDGQD